MNQVDILQSVIDYIEENLAGKIDNVKLQSITSMDYGGKRGKIHRNLSSDF